MNVSQLQAVTSVTYLELFYPVWVIELIELATRAGEGPSEAPEGNR